MPSVCLTASDKSYQTYITDNQNITVSKDDFKQCKLFIFFKHTPDKELTNDHIYAYKLGLRPGSITIKKDDAYSENPLSYARVYFNRYDDNYQNPLILLLNFKNKVQGQAQILYYKLSNFDSDKTTNLTISNLSRYTNESDLCNQLLQENEKLNYFLTYDLGMVKRDNMDKYNNNKISISIKKDISKKYRSNYYGFYKCIHTPKVNGSKTYKSLIIYGGRIPQKKDSSDKMVDLIEIQGHNYKSVTVYFGSNAKRAITEVNRQENIPLMLELVKEATPHDTEYYCHHRSDKSLLFWEKLDISNYEKYTGTTLQNINQISNSIKKEQILIKILKRLESYFFKTLVIMITKQKSYSKTDVIVSYIDYYKSTIINQNSELSVVETTNHNNSLLNTGYKVFEHDISSIISTNEDFQLKFILPITDNVGKYSEICLYNYKSSRAEDMENLNYFSGGLGEDKVSVYFYGNDPRPLLVSFGDRAYRPKNKDKYLTEWIRVNDIDELINGNGDKLLQILSEVVGFLNEVNIYEHSNSYYYGNNYEVHRYDNGLTEINVVSHNFNCYTKYTHKPKNSQGYRLGNVVYKKDNIEKGRISYSYHSTLVQVNVYYFNYDSKRHYPLLVELEFQGSNGNSFTSKEHHKLFKCDHNIMKWEIDYYVNQLESEGQQLISYLDFVKNFFKHVPELKGFNYNCGHNHSTSLSYPGTSYIPQSHQASEQSLHNSSYGNSVQHAHERSPSSRSEVHVVENRQTEHSNHQHTHIAQPPAESKVERATRIASTVGTFAIAGTGTGVAIYKYSQWFINLFRRLF